MNILETRHEPFFDRYGNSDPEESEEFASWMRSIVMEYKDDPRAILTVPHLGDLSNRASSSTLSPRIRK